MAPPPRRSLAGLGSNRELEEHRSRRSVRLGGIRSIRARPKDADPFLTHDLLGDLGLGNVHGVGSGGSCIADARELIEDGFGSREDLADAFVDDLAPGAGSGRATRARSIEL
jgi:hypothetical protein